jgi:hypothetical protein
MSAPIPATDLRKSEPTSKPIFMERVGFIPLEITHVHTFLSPMQQRYHHDGFSDFNVCKQWSLVWEPDILCHNLS